MEPSDPERPTTPVITVSTAEATPEIGEKPAEQLTPPAELETHESGYGFGV